MTEIEQLRKEINELRERIAMLEARPVGAPLRIDWTHKEMPSQTPPQWVRSTAIPFGTVIC